MRRYKTRDILFGGYLLKKQYMCNTFSRYIMYLRSILCVFLPSVNPISYFIEFIIAASFFFCFFGLVSQPVLNLTSLSTNTQKKEKDSLNNQQLSVFFSFIFFKTLQQRTKTSWCWWLRIFSNSYFSDKCFESSFNIFTCKCRRLNITRTPLSCLFHSLLCCHLSHSITTQIFLVSNKYNRYFSMLINLTT